MIVSNFARIDRSDRDRYHLCLEETRRRGCWRGKTGSSSFNFSLARCSNFRRHGKGNQIQSRENSVCSIVGALRGEAPAPFHRILISLFKQESKGCRCSALDLIVSSVGSTPRGEHAADLVSRHESGCRWNTRLNAFSFARRWRVFPGFDETFIRLNISRRNITFNDLSSPLALSRSSYYKRISREKRKIRLYRDDFFFPNMMILSRD